jgi:metal-responsive CopG/Arc/MetJ family transcriptional regulator
MKHHIGLTIDAKLLKEIEELRGREKRSTFIEHLIRLGLKAYIKNVDMETFDLRKIRSFSKA